MIAIRNLTGDEKIINANLQLLKNHGCINYFGSQRFGVSSIGTHELGKFVLQKKFGMVSLLFFYFGSEKFNLILTLNCYMKTY